MFPPQGSPAPGAAPGAPAAAGAVPQQGGTPPAGNQAIMQFRKALGVPADQPAPEQAVIDACMGTLGPDLKRMAAAVVGSHNLAPGAGPGGDETRPPVTPDPGQAGGEPSPPPPSGPGTGDASSVQPGAATDGKMGSATIFGRPPVSAAGAQPAGSGGPEDEEDEEHPTSRSMFGRR